MKYNKKIFMILASFLLCSFTSCENNPSGSLSEPESSQLSSEFSEETSSEVITEPSRIEPDISGQTIYWLADYNLNPENGENRSTALSLFEDIYGGKIEYIHADADEKFEVLDTRIRAGEPVDMFPYEVNAIPEGVTKNLYQPLDEYFDILEWDSELWEDMHSTADMFSYNGSHYVLPYSISDPFVITYSRKLMKSENFEDPYKLYQEGKWDWNIFMNMMKTFESRQVGDIYRYGIAGQFGKAFLYSSGKTVVSLENGKLVNNIGDASIAKAETLMNEIGKNGLYNDSWYSNFPSNENTLFYAMESWSLGESNAINPDSDLMIVPFPKSPDTDKYYMSANYNARMLVKNSDKGEAVSAYIKCERLAETSKKYQEEKKKQALQKKTTPKGIVTGFITEEQYNALQEYTNPEKCIPVFDFGYGMGSAMYGEGDYTYATSGVMNKLVYELIEDNGHAENWDTLRDSCKDIIDAEIVKLNK